MHSRAKHAVHSKTDNQLVQTLYLNIIEVLNDNQMVSLSTYFLFICRYDKKLLDFVCYVSQKSYFGSHENISLYFSHLFVPYFMQVYQVFNQALCMTFTCSLNSTVVTLQNHSIKDRPVQVQVSIQKLPQHSDSQPSTTDGVMLIMVKPHQFWPKASNLA